MAFERITVDPAVMGGQPTVRGLRFPVKTVVRMVAGGMTISQVLEEHPDLTENDVREALEFAAAALDGDSYLPLSEPA